MRKSSKRDVSNPVYPINYLDKQSIIDLFDACFIVYKLFTANNGVFSKSFKMGRVRGFNLNGVT